MAKTPLERLAAASTSAFERKEPRPNAHFIVSKVKLVDESNSKLDWNILAAVEEMPLTWTITGASTVEVTCEDASGELLNDPIFSKWMFRKLQVSKSSAKTYSGRKVTDSSKTARYGEEEEEEWILPSRPIDLNLDGVWFRLAGFRVQETKLILTFEDRVAAILRSERGRIVTATRGKLTRAQFLEKLVREAEHHHRQYGRIGLFVPEANIKQAEAVLESESGSSSSSAGGLGEHEGVTVKGQPASTAQIQILNEALEVAYEKHSPFKAKVALIEAIIQEDDCTNGPHGVLELEPATQASMGIKSAKDVQEVSAAFLERGFTGKGGANALSRALPHLTAGEIAQLVQGSAFSGESTYGTHRAEAEAIVRKYGSTEGPTGREVTHPAPYQFTRGPMETSWDCIQRLASEVSWYAFVRDNQLWYVSGDYLLAQEPKLHVVRGRHGVDWVEPNVDIGARDNIAEVSVKGRATLWTALPGMCVSVARVGPANGKWVVNTIKQNLLDRSNATTIQLQKPLPARPEPASTSTETGPASSEGGSTSGAPSKSALAAFNASNTLSQMQLPYLLGGGHQANGLVGVRRGGPGLDCSGSTCWVLHEAGMFPATEAVVSGDLEQWGDPGQGNEMTVWAGANHVYIEFHVQGHEEAQMNTNGPQDGPRLYTQRPGVSGAYNGPNGSGSGGPFTPRHWPGT